MIRFMETSDVRRTEIRTKIYRRRKPAEDLHPAIKTPGNDGRNKCTNASCRLRKAGCRGFEGCPGFQSG
jgi:hypothetical protein